MRFGRVCESWISQGLWKPLFGRLSIIVYQQRWAYWEEQLLKKLPVQCARVWMNQFVMLCGAVIGQVMYGLVRGNGQVVKWIFLSFGLIGLQSYLKIRWRLWLWCWEEFGRGEIVWSLKANSRDLIKCLIKLLIVCLNFKWHKHSKAMTRRLVELVVVALLIGNHLWGIWLRLIGMQLWKSENRGGIGVVIHDSCREVLVSLCYPREFVYDPVVAEVYAF